MYRVTCPKCGKHDVMATEVIEAFTDLHLVDGEIVDTNNEYGNGLRIEFKCKSCGHRWTGRKGVSIESYNV